MPTPEELSSQEQTVGELAPPVEARLAAPFPAWSWLDLGGITLVTILALAACVFLLGAVVGAAIMSITGQLSPANIALLGILAQAVAYALVLGYMATILRSRSGRPARTALQWNWSGRSLTIGGGGGILLAVVTMLLQYRLPVPKDLPIEQLFKGTWTAYSFAAFAVLLAPLFEEVYFRGLLFPLVQRGLGRWAAVLITSSAFALIHGVQLAFSWSALLSVFFVGLVLTIVRARFNSVGASWMVHVAYNTTLMSTLWFSTEHFRNFEKLN